MGSKHVCSPIYRLYGRRCQVKFEIKRKKQKYYDVVVLISYILTKMGVLKYICTIEQVSSERANYHPAS